jgi:glycosyltransferase involved in cell wall biosynthesis
VLHELKLHHFFEWIYHRQPSGRETYLHEMMRYYGLKGREAGEKYWRDELTIDFMADHYPLTPLALESSLGVLVHTPDAFNSLMQLKRWPVTYAPLPYTPQSLKSKIIRANRPPYQLIVFGYISTNRRLDSILTALANFPQKSYFRLNIYGEIWDSTYINNRIHELNLDSLVTVQGFVKEEQLEMALANSNLAINLRHPTMGEASASQLRIWSHKLPSLVTKTGWYAGLPENTVYFVDPDQEIQDIQKLLRSFLDDPSSFYKVGENGHSLLKKEYEIESYVSTLMKFAGQLKCTNSSYVVSHLVKSIFNNNFMLYARSENPDEFDREVAKALYFLSSS